jgi:hypothetical protein
MAALDLWWDAGNALLEKARFGSPRRLWHALYLLAGLARARTAVRLCRGRAGGEGDLSIAVAGPRTLASELSDILLQGEAEVRRGPRGRLRRPRDLDAGADLEAALVHPWHADRWARAGWTVVPRTVCFQLRHPRDWRPPAGRRERGLLRELQRGERAGFDVEEAPARAALAEFRARMVEPYARTRFGRDARVAIGRAARRGTILFLNRDGVRVAGILLVPLRSRLVLLRLGVLDGREDLLREGVVAAMYREAIGWAARRGYETVDGGLSSAFVQDGVHRWKLKWRFLPDEVPFLDRLALRARTPAGRRAIEQLVPARKDASPLSPDRAAPRPAGAHGPLASSGPPERPPRLEARPAHPRAEAIRRKGP